MSNVTVDLLTNALTGIMLDVPTNIGVDVNVNVFAGVMTTFEVAIPSPLKEFCC